MKPLCHIDRWARWRSSCTRSHECGCVEYVGLDHRLSFQGFQGWRWYAPNVKLELASGGANAISGGVFWSVDFWDLLCRFLSNVCFAWFVVSAKTWMPRWVLVGMEDINWWIASWARDVVHCYLGIELTTAASVKLCKVFVDFRGAYCLNRIY